MPEPAAGSVGDVVVVAVPVSLVIPVSFLVRVRAEHCLLCCCCGCRGGRLQRRKKRRRLCGRVLRTAVARRRRHRRRRQRGRLHAPRRDRRRKLRDTACEGGRDDGAARIGKAALTRKAKGAIGTRGRYDRRASQHCAPGRRCSTDTQRSTKYTQILTVTNANSPHKRRPLPVHQLPGPAPFNRPGEAALQVMHSGSFRAGPYDSNPGYAGGVSLRPYDDAAVCSRGLAACLPVGDGMPVSLGWRLRLPACSAAPHLTLRPVRPALSKT